MDVVSICNTAILAVGHDQITSVFPPDPSKQARLCSQFYNDTRDELLMQYDWNCARARAALPALATGPLWGFNWAYQVPTDFLFMLGTDQDDPQQFDVQTWNVEGTTIVTDIDPPLNIVYTRQLPDPTMFDPAFAAALSARLAMKLAMPLAQSETLFKLMSDDYDKRIREARGNSFREIRAEPVADYLLQARA